MSVSRENSVKFDDLVNESLNEEIGTVRVAEFEFQLCDHLDKVGEEYYATALYQGLKPDGRSINGIYYKKMGDLPVALLPLSLLKEAHAVYNDKGQTEAMLTRAVTTLQSLNAKLIAPEVVTGKTSGKVAA
ncbi:MAG: hypothetical protein LRY36_01640 [Alphaproteobacteria bacterium]|nr:hypothetical protein [Alphaproteobacteria bacterium]